MLCTKLLSQTIPTDHLISDCSHVTMNTKGVALVAGTYGLLMRSEDKGATWKQMEKPFRFWSAGIAFLSDTDAVLLCRSTTGRRSIAILYSTNAGVSWNEASVEDSTSSYFYVNALAPVSSRIALAIKDSGVVYRTTDAGRTWKKRSFIDDLTGSLASIAALKNSGTIYAYSLRGIFRSSDTGATWTQVTMPPANGKRGPLSIQPYSATDAVMSFISDTTTAVYSTTNGGMEWKRITGENILGIHYVSMTNAKEGVLYGSLNQIFRTDDSAKTWKLISPITVGDSLTQTQTGFANSIARSDSCILLVGGMKNITRSADGGKSFTPVSGIGVLDSYDDEQSLLSLSIADSTILGISGGNILRSQDNGATLLRTSNPYTKYARKVSIRPGASHVFIHGYDTELWESDNKGVSWTLNRLRSGTILKGDRLEGKRMSFADANTGTVMYTPSATNNEMRIALTTNGGAAWTDMALPDASPNVVPLTPTTFLRNGAVEIIQPYGVATPSAEHEYYATVSNDTGKTWRQIFQSSDSTSPYKTLRFGNGTLVSLIFDYKGNVANFYIQTSADEGKTWTRRNTEGLNRIADIAVSGSRAVLYSDTNLLYCTSDYGTTWKKYDTDAWYFRQYKTAFYECSFSGNDVYCAAGEHRSNTTYFISGSDGKAQLLRFRFPGDSILSAVDEPATETIEIEIPSYVTQLAIVSIAPNPSVSKRVHINMYKYPAVDIRQSTLALYNILGEQMLDLTAALRANATAGQFTFDANLTEVPAGVYYLVSNVNNYRQTKMLIVQ
ncbi:MAG: hypothetical protein JNL32_07150 [Candidatus Kapabacteria bacterium]|nr:hypothetical protein [Candidatus Kapabacteria bacterium]